MVWCLQQVKTRWVGGVVACRRSLACLPTSAGKRGLFMGKETAAWCVERDVSTSHPGGVHRLEKVGIYHNLILIYYVCEGFHHSLLMIVLFNSGLLAQCSSRLQLAQAHIIFQVVFSQRWFHQTGKRLPWATSPFDACPSVNTTAGGEYCCR